jgi:hypothetical protein
VLSAECFYQSKSYGGQAMHFPKTNPNVTDAITTKPSKSFFYYGGFLALIYFFVIFKALGSTQMILLVSLICIPTILLCPLWYWLSTILPKRGRILSLLGITFFILGTIMPFVVLYQLAADIKTGKTVLSYKDVLIFWFIWLSNSILIFALAKIFCFHRKKRA